jgi:hypothetical protein
VPQLWHSAKKALPSACRAALDKAFLKTLSLVFAECQIKGTRQSIFLILKKSLPSARSRALDKDVNYTDRQPLLLVPSPFTFPPWHRRPSLPVLARAPPTPSATAPTRSAGRWPPPCVRRHSAASLRPLHWSSGAVAVGTCGSATTFELKVGGARRSLGNLCASSVCCYLFNSYGYSLCIEPFGGRFGVRV